MESKFCLICLTRLPYNTRNQVQNVSKSRLKLLTGYLVNSKEQEGENVLRRILELGENSVNFCDKCGLATASVVEAHTKLEKLQLELIDKLREMRKLIVESALENYNAECSNLGRSDLEYFSVLNEFKEEVTKNDFPHIPFVFLERCKLTSEHVHFDENMLDVLKTEPEVEFYEDDNHYLEVEFNQIAKRHVSKRKLKTGIPKKKYVKKIKLSESKSSPPKSYLFYCESCSYSTPVFLRLDQHLRCKHDNDSKPFVCDLENCNESFSTQQYLEIHLERHQGKYKLKCDICKAKYSTFDLADHLKTHVQELFPCTKCPQINSSFQNYRKHLVHVHGATGTLSKRKPRRTRIPIQRKKYVKKKKVKLSKPKSSPLKSYRFYCESCSYSTPKFLRLDQHLRLKHENENDTKPFACDIENCNESFSNQQYLKIHLERHQGKYKLKCDVCKAKYSAFDLADHLKTHVQELFPCSKCPQISSSSQNYMKHLVHVHGTSRTLNCGLCGDIFSNKKDLREHLIQAHQVEEVTRVIDEIQKMERNQKKSGQTKTAIEEKKIGETKPKTEENKSEEKNVKDLVGLQKPAKLKQYMCDQCGRSFSRKELLKHHEFRHTRPFHCDKCGERFASTTALENHLIKKHDMEKFKCDLCDLEFGTRLGLNNHKSMDHLGKGKRCPVCDLNCGTESSLQRHLETKHSTTNNYICEECGKAFRTAKSHERHRQTHGEKIFKCTYCDKAFSMKKNVVIHERVHTGERPCVCDGCGKAYKQDGDLYRHKKRCNSLPEKSI